MKGYGCVMVVRSGWRVGVKFSKSGRKNRNPYTVGMGGNAEICGVDIIDCEMIGSILRKAAVCGAVSVWMLSASCGKDGGGGFGDGGHKDDDEEDGGAMVTEVIQISAGDRVFTATLEDNSSAKALAAMLMQGPVEVAMSDYGDMEKVGDLGVELPRNDKMTTTSPGDLILYQGDSFVIYYDSNTWNFTRLGHVDGVTSRSGMLELLGGKGDVVVTLSAVPVNSRCCGCSR